MEANFTPHATSGRAEHSSCLRSVRAYAPTASEKAKASEAPGGSTLHSAVDAGLHRWLAGQHLDAHRLLAGRLGAGAVRAAGAARRCADPRFGQRIATRLNRPKTRATSAATANTS